METNCGGWVVSITVDGVEVEGEITQRCSADVTIRIVKPYMNLSTGSHIPYFARAHHSFDGEYGDSACKALLGELYRIALALDSGMPKMREGLSRMREKLRDAAQGIDRIAFLDRKRVLRKTMKQGLIDSKAYQKQLCALRKMLGLHDSALRAALDDFFEEYFPMRVPYGTRQEVLDVIEGRTSLAPKARSG